MEGKWWAVLIGVLVLGVGFIWWMNAPRVSPYDVPNEPPGHGVVGNVKLDADPFDVTITYTADGLVPQDSTIKKGQRVRFENDSKEAFWPASGVHPTHSLYPEKESTDCLGSSFDACQDLKTGEFFDFTFNYPGTWPFHDHLHAYHSGSITVTP